MSAVATPVRIPTTSWSVDPVHSSIGFGVKHLGVSIYRGSFPGVTGRIETSDGVLALAEKVTLDFHVEGVADAAAEAVV